MKLLRNFMMMQRKDSRKCNIAKINRVVVQIDRDSLSIKHLIDQMKYTLEESLNS